MASLSACLTHQYGSLLAGVQMAHSELIPDPLSIGTSTVARRGIPRNTFFEENRTQSKIFLGMQENSTMTRYASL